MKYILFIIISFSFLEISCKKEKANLYMSGVIYDNCYDRNPLRNGKIRLFRTKGGNVSYGKVVGVDSTDENGHFKIYFPQEHANNSMKLQTIHGNDLMEKIPPTGNMENVEVFATAPATISISLNVINPHQNGDTLLLMNLNSLRNPIKIPCPLKSGYVYTVTNFTTATAMGLNGTELDIIWGFNPSTGFSYSNSFLIKKYCGEINDFSITIK